MTASALTLPPRWYPLRPHPKHDAFMRSTRRFNIVPAGRRSGKTEIAKRRLIRRAVRGSRFDRPSYFYAAPTRDQAKRIAWEDLKRMVPPDAMAGDPSESELFIPLWHGGRLWVLGLDKPQRIEGSPWDHGVIDEYGDMKPEAWGANVRPALSDRRGTCDLIGVPEGRNHYYDLWRATQNDTEWGRFHWTSAEILPPEEIAAAKRDLDLLTFQQEYEASFVNFAGRCYYAFTDDNVRAVRSLYDPKAPLIVALDFNVAPGVAAIAQERTVQVGEKPITATCVLAEVYIPDNSNTPAVCRKVLREWGAHTGRVVVYGDATGGARGTAQVAGSDWDLVKRILRAGEPAEQLAGFGDRLTVKVKSANPAERARVNAMNSRCCTADGTRRLFVDPQHAPHVVKDLEGVTTLDGGSGEIDKKANPKLTHISDALGYYVEHEFPVNDRPSIGFTTFRI